MTEACDLTATAARRLIGRRALSPVELLDSCLARIAAVDGAVNAWATLDPDTARVAARAAEAAVMRGDALEVLHGLPVGVKDLDETAGLRTTWGSTLFRDHVPAADGLMVAKVRAAGAVILGKTNVPEFGLGANTRNAVCGATGNPFDPTRSAAGSSGGSAVALACGMVPIATGSDTGGSLRNPAAFNGVVGFRPSPGLVPNARARLGWNALSVLGPMARNVADVALLLAAQAGDDAADPLAYTLPGRSVRAGADHWHPVREVDLAPLRLAFSEDFGAALVEPVVRAAFRDRVDAIAGHFAMAEAAHPDVTGGDAAFEVLRAAGALAAHLDRVRAHPDQCGPNMHANVAEGLGYTLADQARAHADQTALYRRFIAFFERFDILVTPAITISPRPWRELFPAEIDGQATRTYFHWLALSYYVTLTGNPAISIPLGRDALGMPFGLQIVGPRGGDALVLGVAAAIEAALADDPVRCRPVPDLVALRTAPPIRGMEGFLSFD